MCKFPVFSLFISKEQLISHAYDKDCTQKCKERLPLHPLFGRLQTIFFGFMTFNSYFNSTEKLYFEIRISAVLADCHCPCICLPNAVPYALPVSFPRSHSRARRSIINYYYIQGGTAASITLIGVRKPEGCALKVDEQMKRHVRILIYSICSFYFLKLTIACVMLSSTTERKGKMC